eukprot:2730209-Pyramimonas_sp.AAC.1
MTRHVDDIIADVIVVMVVRPAEGGPAGEHDARDAAAAAAAAAAADGRGVGEAEAAGGTRRRARVRSDQLTLRVHSGFPSRDWLSFVQVAMALQQQQQQQQLAQVVVREQAMWEMQRMREEQLREQKHREEAMREQQVGQITRKSVAFATRGGEVASHQMEHNGKQRGQACEHKWCGLVPLVARVEVAGQCSFWICPLGTRSSCDMKCCDDVGRSSAGGQMWERRMREQQQAEEQQRRQKQQAELLKQQHQQQQQQQQQKAEMERRQQLLQRQIMASMVGALLSHRINMSHQFLLTHDRHIPIQPDNTWHKLHNSGQCMIRIDAWIHDSCGMVGSEYAAASDVLKSAVCVVPLDYAERESGLGVDALQQQPQQQYTSLFSHGGGL